MILNPRIYRLVHAYIYSTFFVPPSDSLRSNHIPRHNIVSIKLLIRHLQRVHVTQKESCLCSRRSTASIIHTQSHLSTPRFSESHRYVVATGGSLSVHRPRAARSRIRRTCPVSATPPLPASSSHTVNPSSRSNRTRLHSWDLSTTVKHTAFFFGDAPICCASLWRAFLPSD